MGIHKIYVLTLLLTGFVSYSNELTLKTGVFTDKLTLSKGMSMKFKARVPMELPTEKTLGLILAFHPHGGNENSMINWPVKTFLERQKVLDKYVIIGLKSRRPER